MQFFEHISGLAAVRRAKLWDAKRVLEEVHCNDFKVTRAAFTERRIGSFYSNIMKVFPEESGDFSIASIFVQKKIIKKKIHVLQFFFFK